MTKGYSKFAVLPLPLKNDLEVGDIGDLYRLKRVIIVAIVLFRQWERDAPTGWQLPCLPEVKGTSVTRPGREVTRRGDIKWYSILCSASYFWCKSFVHHLAGEQWVP